MSEKFKNTIANINGGAFSFFVTLLGGVATIPSLLNKTISFEMLLIIVLGIASFVLVFFYAKYRILYYQVNTELKKAHQNQSALNLQFQSHQDEIRDLQKTIKEDQTYQARLLETLQISRLNIEDSEKLELMYNLTTTKEVCFEHVRNTVEDNQNN